MLGPERGYATCLRTPVITMNMTAGIWSAWTKFAVRLAGISDPGRLLQGIFAYAPFGLQVYRADGHCLLTNKAFRDLFGSEPPPEYNVLHDEIAERQGLLGLVKRAFAGETVQTPTFWYDPRDLEQVHVTEGRRVAISITLMPLFGASGAVEHVALVIKDQTEETLARERAEAARADAEGLAAQRAEQERWLQTVLDQMPMPLIFVEPKTARLFFANAAAERMAGGALPRPQSAEDYLRLFDVRDLDDRPLRLEDMPAVRAARGEAVSGAQVRWYTPDGPKVITIHAARIPAMFGHPETVLDRLRRHHGAQGGAGAAGGGGAGAPGLPVDRGPRAEDAADVRAAEPARGGQGAAGRRARGRPALRRALAGAAAGRSAGSRGWSISCWMSRESPRARWCWRPSRSISPSWCARWSAAFHSRRMAEAGAITCRRRGRSKGLGSPAARADPDEPAVQRRQVRRGPADLGRGRRERARDERTVWIAVRDHGIGMSSDELGRIFGRFERAVSERNYGGLGLGLWIVRQVVDAMGGTISVESQPGRGSTFTVRLPRHAAPPAPVW